MKDEDLVTPGHPLYLEAVALALAVRTIRRAQGKKSPADVQSGTPESRALSEEFVRDLHRAVGGGPADFSTG
jgi:hypothetical protein